MITVSIVCYHTSTDELRQCLASLDSSLVEVVYIVDNSSQDYLRDFCKGYAKVEYLPSENVGYGAGHNKALRLAMQRQSEYHLVLNSDVRFTPDILAIITDYMNINKDVAQVQPRIVNPDGSLQYTCRLLPTPIDLIFRRFLPGRLAKVRDNRYLMMYSPHDKAINVAYHQGSFMLFRTKCFNVVGLFDERFFMYPEDIDITRRMHRNYRTMYFPYATVVHDHRAASYHSWRMLRIHTVNMIKYFNKWGWFFDAERREWNHKLLEDTGYYIHKQ